jgi:glycosyltransferase involved in cell wall biosynthesis
MPEISVIIPCYNSGKYVAQAAESSLSQTLAPCEVIVVDDGSTDDPATSLRGLAGRITLLRQENRGVSAARNVGAEAARGDVLAFLDADDWWPNNLLEACAPMVSRGNAVGYNCDVCVEGTLPPGATAPDSSTLAEWMAKGPRHLNRENLSALFTIPSLFKFIVHREDHSSIGGFDGRFNVVEDFHYVVRLISRGVTLNVVDNPRGFYRFHAASALRSLQVDSSQRLREVSRWLELFDDLYAHGELPPEAAKIARRMVRYYRARKVIESMRVQVCGGHEVDRSRASAREMLQSVPQLATLGVAGALRKTRAALSGIS